MRVRVRWQELSTYEQEIVLPEGTDLETFIEESGGDGEPLWFDQVDEQNPDWFKSVTVEERELIEYEEVRNSEGVGSP
jgi:hypothetical protein